MYLWESNGALNFKPRISACRMMRGVTLTYDARKSKRELRIRKVVGLAPSKKGVKEGTFWYRAQKIKKHGFWVLFSYKTPRCQVAHSQWFSLMMMSWGVQLHVSVLIMRGGRVLAEAKPDFCIRVWFKSYLYGLKLKIHTIKSKV